MTNGRVFASFYNDWSVTEPYKLYYYYSVSHVDGAWSCRPSSLSVCLFVIVVVSRAETAQSIQMLFEFRTRVGLGKHVLDGGPDPPRKGAIFGGEVAVMVKCADTLPQAVKKGWTDWDAIWVMELGGL